MPSETAGPPGLKLLARNPIRYFVIWSLGAAGISALIYWIFASIQEGTWMPHAKEDLAAPVAIALGTAVAFGGSIVAIAIASVALNLQKAQEARENLQAKVELLRLFSEESAKFLVPYAAILLSIRRLTAIMELGYDKFVKPLDKERLLDPAYVSDPVVQEMLEDLAPQMRGIADVLGAISTSVAELHVAAGANAFASAIFRSGFPDRRWCLTSVTREEATIRLSALPTVCAWLESRSKEIRRLADDQQKLWKAVAQARLAANACRSRDGSTFEHKAILGLLVLGFLLPGELEDNDLEAGHEIRPALVELIYQLVAAYSSRKASAALHKLFEGNPELAPVIGTLTDLLPNPVDSVMQEYLDAYSSLQPRLKLTKDGFA